MRRVLVLVGLSLALAFGSATAQPDPYGRVTPPGHQMPEPQIMNEKPSGFRMDGHQAKGGAYRYRLMIVGGFCVMLTTALLIRYLGRINRSRA